MKNCLIVDVTSFYGGGQRFVSDLAIASKGYFDLHIFTANEKLKNEVADFPVTLIPDSYSQFFSIVSTINRYVREHKIDSVIFNGNRAIYLIPFIRCKNKIAYKHTTHVAVKSGIKRLVAILSLELSYLFADKIVLLFEKAREEVILSGKKVTIIQNGLDEHAWRKKTERKTPVSPRIIMQVGRLEPEKGQIEAIRALMEVSKYTSDFEYWIAGAATPEYQQYIEEFIATNGLTFVKLLGYRNILRELLEEADIIVLPSHYEAFPFVILEAMSMELAVVASDVGGMYELVVPGENGFLFPVRDEAALAGHLRTLLENEALTLEFGKNGRKRFVENFRLELVVQKLVKLL
jgi:glycosyltransferase involved in cell wall biosynthesis